MKSYIILLLGAVSLSTLFGCASSGDMQRLDSQLSSVRADMRTLKGSVEEANLELSACAGRDKDILARLDADGAMLKGLTDDMAVVKRNQADLGSKLFTMTGGGDSGALGGQVDELRHGLETTNAKLDAVKAMLQQQTAALDRLSAGMENIQAQPQPQTQPQPFAATTSVSGGEKKAQAPVGKKAAPPAGDPIQMYQSAYLDYTKGNYDVAITGFRDYLSAYPDAEFAGNAQYWIGESLYSLGRFEEALVEFDKDVKNYPDSSKVPGAMLKKGYCYEELKLPKEAKAVYDVLMGKFPNSEAAKLAGERLKPGVRGKVRGK